MRRLAFIALCAAAPVFAQEAVGPLCAVRGMALGLYADSSDADVIRAVREVRDLGANAVLLKVSEVQEDWRSVVIAPDPHTTIPVRRLVAAAREAKRAGLRVALMPIVLLRAPKTRTHWRGMIEPLDSARWFRSYEGAVLKYARLAEEEGMDFLGVGSELVSMERHADRWRELIRRVRERYRGKLFYSSNWDHLEVSPAWGDLDYLGLSAYYELARRGGKPEPAELAQRWREIRATVDRWGARLDKPLLITEVGYPSRTDSLWDPWDHTRKARADPAQQELGYRAFLEGWEGDARLHGVFFYEWRGEGGFRDSGYTPRGKPGARVLQRWMRHP